LTRSAVNSFLPRLYIRKAVQQHEYPKSEFTTRRVPFRTEHLEDAHAAGQRALFESSTML
jgi:hypothetical protein